jgi:hypothetical protein
MGFAGRLRTITPREVAFRLAEGATFARERAEAARGARPTVERPGGTGAVLPRVLFGALAERDAARRLWTELFPESAREAVSFADGICENRIPLFSDVVEFGKDIKWNLEYRSGKQAPLRFYRDLHGIDPRDVGDTKNIWELNRHNFFLHCAKAYLATGERRYYEKWREMLLSWIERNPYNVGINWESSIELAIRAINWIWSSWFFAGELEKDRDAAECLRESVVLHAIHIDGHLSRYFSPNTHLTAEALGLVYIGTSFPGVKEASRWVSRGLAILDAELDRQVLEDGGYFEMATYYHKYTIDFYLHYLLLAGDRAKRSPRAASKIKKLVKHLMLIAEPDGTIPLIGDSDGGELLHLGAGKRNMTGACGAAAVLLEDPELASLCGDTFREEVWWLLGRRGIEAFRRMRRGAAPRPCHSINSDSGLFCFRTGMAHGDSFVTIDCGRHGWGACGHAHADLLSFEWFCDGSKVIVDPGTYAYKGSHASRDEIRSSQRHNTITIDDVSQSIPGDTFKWKKVAHPKRVWAKTFENIGLFEGEHDAYDSRGCRHRRALLFFGKELTVVADFITVSRHNESLLHVLQFGEGTLENVGEQVYRFSSSRNAKSYFVGFLGTRDFLVSIRESEIYPDYNKAVPAPRIELVENDISSDHMIVTLLGDDVSILRSFRLNGEGRLVGRSASGEIEILCAAQRIDRVLVNGSAVPL